MTILYVILVVSQYYGGSTVLNKINNIQVRLHVLFPSTITFNAYVPAYAVNVRCIIT